MLAGTIELTIFFLFSLDLTSCLALLPGEKSETQIRMFSFFRT